MRVQPKLAIEGGPKAVSEEIPFVGFGADLIGEEEEAAVLDVIRTRKLCRLTHPFKESYVNRFEEQILERLKPKYVHAVNSCANALYAAMVAIGAGPGDEVLVSAAGWFSISNAVQAVGAVPVPVEFDESLSIDPDDLEAKITSRTKAVIVVQWRGMPANMDRVMEIARRRNIKVVEDCAQSFGATYKGRYVGTIGDVGCYSFNLHKVITCGEGGAVVTNDPKLFQRAVSVSGMYNHWRHYYKDPEDTGPMPALPMLNFRMPELCGAMVWAQMQKLDDVLGRMRARRDQLLEGLKKFPQLKLAPRHDPAGECGYTVPLLFKSKHQAEFFTAALKAEGVPTVSTMEWAFGGGEGRGTGALVVSEGGNPGESGAMALADFWRPLVQQAGLSETLNPWKLHPNPPKLPEGIIPKTKERLAKVATLKLNTMIEPRHVEQILEAIAKVVPALPA